MLYASFHNLACLPSTRELIDLESRHAALPRRYGRDLNGFGVFKTA